MFKRGGGYNYKVVNTWKETVPPRKNLPAYFPCTIHHPEGGQDLSPHRNLEVRMVSHRTREDMLLFVQFIDQQWNLQGLF